MPLKVRGGTAIHGEPSLCLTCCHATVIKGQRLRDEFVVCERFYPERRVYFPVHSCTSYRDVRLPSIREMEEIAWILKSDPKRNTIGFVHAGTLDDDEKHGRDE